VAKLLAFPVADGAVLVEVRSAEGEVIPVGVIDSVIERVDTSLDDMFAIVGRIARSLERAVANAPVQEAEVSFGLTFSGKGTLYLVASSLEASLSVKLTINARGHPAT
jgi:hypothetical protein